MTPNECEILRAQLDTLKQQIISFERTLNLLVGKIQMQTESPIPNTPPESFNMDCSDEEESYLKETLKFRKADNGGHSGADAEPS